MKKVTALIGTQTKKATYQALQEFEANLQQLGEIDFEYLFLNDYRLEFCRGCKVCFDRGEEHCPLKDDRDTLLKKMGDSDGVIFATPSYAFQVSARLKNLLDRTAFTNHRPRFFGKACTAVVTHGIPGGGSDCLKYLCFAAENMGFHASKGCLINSLAPMTHRQQKEMSRKVKKASARFHRALISPLPPPSFMRLVIFRLTRPLIMSAGEEYRDYHYYKEKGWFESEYYYPVSLGLPKKLAGYLFDVIGRRMARSR